MLTVLFFAQLADQGGGARRDLAPASTAQALVDRESSLGFLKDRSIRVAVNRQWAHWDTSLADGDEVAFLPPTSAL